MNRESAGSTAAATVQGQSLGFERTTRFCVLGGRPEKIQNLRGRSEPREGHEGYVGLGRPSGFFPSESMNSHSIWAAALLTVGLGAQHQPWNQEELTKHLDGYLEPRLAARLATTAGLVQHKDEALLAIVQRIHGNHHEYQQEVERLLDLLVDERWLKREEAERALIETGANARALIEQRAGTGKTLEERSRCQRILDKLASKGTEREDREVKMLRGLVSAAPVLGSGAAMVAALRAAAGHSDPLVCEGAIRALGVLGGDPEAEMLRKIAESGPVERRPVALAALGRMTAPKAVEQVQALVEGGKLTPLELVGLVRDLRNRPDAAALLAGLGKHADARVASAVAAPGLDPAVPPLTVKLVTTDNAVLQVEVLGIRGDCLLVKRPIEGLDQFEIPMREFAAITCAAVAKPAQPRVFLKRGSLVSGPLLGIDAAGVTIESSVFGKLTIPRTALQGVAFDGSLDRLLGSSETNDKLRTKAGASVECKLLSLAGDRLTIESAGAKTEMPVGEAMGVVFTRPVGNATEAGRYARVELANGDRLLGQITALGSGMLVLVAPDLGTAKLAWKDIARLEFDCAGGAVWGFTLIADYSESCVFEVDEQGKEVFRLDNLPGAWDAECLENGNLLVTEFQAGRVREITRAGVEVWAYTKLKNPYCARRLANGNTLIADTFANRVIEVDRGGNEIWSYAKGIKPSNCERLANGNTLIADMLKDRVIEVSPGGDIVWQVVNMIGVYDADRLPNGNTLVTLRTLNKVQEIDPTGKVVWQLANLLSPSDADRLPNGNTLVAENGGVREFDRAGNVVWKRACTWAVEANRY